MTSAPLDVAAAWTEDRKALTIGIVNPTEQKCELAMDLKGDNLTGQRQALDDCTLRPYGLQ